MEIVAQVEPEAAGMIIGFIVVGLVLIIVVLLPVVIARWIFRVNEMVLYQRQIIEQLIGLRQDLQARASD